MTMLWTMQAARDRLNPVVIGFVHGSPEVLVQHGPGIWDAVSDCFIGSRLQHRVAGAVLGWSRDASEFLTYARLCEELPSAPAVLDGRSRLPTSSSLCLTLSLNVLHALSNKAAAEDSATGTLTRDFLEMALDRMPNEIARITASLALESYGLPVRDRDLVLDRMAVVLGNRVSLTD